MAVAVILSIPITLFGQSGPTFTEVSLASGIDHRSVASDPIFVTQGGGAWFDYDMDGDEDLYLTGGANSDALYRNDGNGSFTDVTSAAGLGLMAGVNTMGVITGDVDNDGYREIFITTEDSHLNHLFYNNGNGTFTDISSAANIDQGGHSASAAFGDFNLDGYLDLSVTNWALDTFDLVDLWTFPTQVEYLLAFDSVASVQNYFYVNNGDMTFTEISASLGVDDPAGCALATTFSDFDNDRDMDLMIGNDFGFNAGNSTNLLFINTYPTVGFNDVSVQYAFDHGMASMGIAIGDYDEDGDLDYYISDMGTDRLLRNDGNSFSDELTAAGLYNDTVLLADQSGYMQNIGWGCGFFDCDNDTDLDLFVANGDVYWSSSTRPSLDSNKLYINNADGTFTDRSFSAGVADTYMSRAIAHCDYDNDGDIDLWVGIVDTVVGNDHSFLYRNNLPTGNWLKVSLVGVVANRDGFGARIEVMFNGRTLIREVDGGSSFLSHHSSIVHFGLDDVTVLDTLRVIWPGGYVDDFYDVNTNQHLTITEQTGAVITGSETGSVLNFDFSIHPNPVTSNRLSYFIRSDKGGSFSLGLFDPLGRQVGVLIENMKVDGTKRSVVNLPEDIASGIYSLILTDGVGQSIRKLSVIR